VKCRVSVVRRNLKGTRQNPERIKSELEVAFRIDDPLIGSSLRHKNGEVSGTTNGSEILRGRVQKEFEDSGNDYGRYGRESDEMATGDLTQFAVREHGAQAGTEETGGLP
jgi:hypothetical protein